MDIQTVGLGIFVVLLLTASRTKRRAFRGLSADDQARLQENFSKRRWTRVAAMLAAIFGLQRLQLWAGIPHEQAVAGMFGAVMLFAAARGLYLQRRLAEMNLPADYRRQFVYVQLLSILAFFAAVIGFAG